LGLSKAYIEKIENDNYPEIPSVYVKGYLRSYAKMLALNLSPEQINHFVYSAPIQSWTGFSNRKQVSASNKYIQWLTFSIISTLIVLVTLWWKSDNLLYDKLSVNESSFGEAMYAMAEDPSLPSH